MTTKMEEINRQRCGRRDDITLGMLDCVVVKWLNTSENAKWKLDKTRLTEVRDSLA